jgi:heat shock protein HslJ
MKTTTSLLIFVLALASCSNGEDTTATALPAGDWQLVDGIATPVDFPITMSIEGNQVSGRAACNSYGGTADVNGSRVFFGEMSQTEMACEQAAMEAEAGFMAALAVIDTFEATEGRLVFSGPGTSLAFEPVAPIPTSALVDALWVLETLIEGDTASSVAGDPATLILHADGSLTASTGCRTLTGRWIDNGGVITVPELSADGECAAELQRQDSLVVTVIADDFSVEVEGDVLRLSSMGGDGLVYRTDA